MKSLIVYFDEPAPIVTPAVHRVFALVGGLDLSAEIKYHRYGMNICEDFLGYRVMAPRDITMLEVHGVAGDLARFFEVPEVPPSDDSAEAIQIAVAAMMRAIACKNGAELEGVCTSLDLQDFDADDLLFNLCENIGDGNNVVNYSMQG